ncbi:MAG: hypothetical protein JNG83_07390 [Opitutaceae bacterium]|nr:hypothetical protein [Opitutaceae bacterium]
MNLSRRWSLFVLAAGLAASAPAAPPGPDRPFVLEALVDFPDDTIKAGRALTPRDIDALMARLAALGIRRVSWAYYGDGRGGYLIPEGFTEEFPYQGDAKSEWRYYAETYRGLGHPLKVAVEAGHRHGLEVYAYFKPYETGPAILFPEGTEAAARWGVLDSIGGRLAWMDPFVRDHPELRIKRRTDDLPDGVATATVRTIRLTKKDAAPTRLTAEHLQIWTSPNNHRYQPKPVPFACRETVEPSPREVRDQHGRVLTRAGDPVRVLTLTGLELTDRYILVTTDFAGGTPDFSNSGLALLTALDAQGREIPGVFASGGTVWAANLVDFRTSGLIFDYGWGAAEVVLDAANRKADRIATADLPLDAAEANGRQGFIAFARGRNQYLPGALCETEPRVQAFWLQCLDDIIAAGVDGVDFREENHSTHTDHPEDYGYNDVVLAKARARSGDLRRAIAAVRGEAYTEFLRECHRRLARSGKPLRYNLQLDFFRPDPPANRRLAYPANIDFQWRRWIDEGIIDAAIMRFFSYPFAALYDDAVAQEMIARSRARGLPVTVNRYIETPGDQLAAEVRRTQADGRFSGFIFYEAASYIGWGPEPGDCRVRNPLVLEAAAAAR